MSKTETITAGRDEADVAVHIGAYACVHCGQDIHEEADGTWAHSGDVIGDADLCYSYFHTDADDGEELPAATPPPVAERPVVSAGLFVGTDDAYAQIVAADGTTHRLRLDADGTPRLWTA